MDLSHLTVIDLTVIDDRTAQRDYTGGHGTKGSEPRCAWLFAIKLTLWQEDKFPVMSGVGIQKSKETQTKETNGELEDYNGMWFYNGGRALVVKRGSTEKHVRTEI